MVEWRLVLWEGRAKLKGAATGFGRKEAEFEVGATHEVRSRVWFYGIHCIYSGLRCIQLKSSLFLGLFWYLDSRFLCSIFIVVLACVFVSVSELERQETVFVGSGTVLFFYIGVLFCVCHLSNDESAEWEVAYTVEKACCLGLFGVIFNI